MKENYPKFKNMGKNQKFGKPCNNFKEPQREVIIITKGDGAWRQNI
jgi:hypothetical protein